MADDIKLQVGLDLDALKISAERGASVLGQAFQGAMSSLLSGQTLGSGLPPSQGVPGQGHMEQMLDALEGVQQTLQAGFSALIQGTGGGVGGPSGASGNNRPPSTGFGGGGGPTPAGGGGGYSSQETWGQSGMAGLRVADRFPFSAAANMFQTDFGRTGVYQFLNQALGDVPLVGKLFGVGADYSQASDEFLKSSTNVLRAGGRDSRRHFRNLGDFEEGHDTLKRHGITIQEAANLSISSASYGSYVVDPLMSIQGRYGLGDKGTDLMRAMVQGGAEPDVHFKAGENEYKNFADVLAVAIGTNLDRGRWGEAFSAMTSAARRITTGDIDKEGLLKTEHWVGNMGSRFQGDTAAHQSMVATLQGLQGGQGGGLAQIMALQGGGLGDGADYFSALDKVNIGAAKGGVGLEAVLNRYKNLGFVKAYMDSGDERDLNRAYIILSRMLPQFKPIDIKEMLRALRKSNPTGPASQLRDTMLNDLKGGDFLPKQEGEVMGQAVSGSFKGVDFTKRMNGDENFGGIENTDDARRQGGFRRGPAVEMIERPADGVNGTEGFGQQRENWPMGPGDEQLPNYRPGWRPARSSDPHGARHMARDIVIGNGKPGERVFAPVAGVWLTQTPARSNAQNIDEGFVGEMLGDNAVRYKFVHLHFDATLRKGHRIAQGQFIGTVAKNIRTPHLHLEARRRGADGKTEVVDPQSTMGIHERNIMTGSEQVAPQDPGPAPEYPVPGQNLDPTSSEGRNPKLLKPEDVVPISQAGRMDVHVYVHDTRVTVSRRHVKSGAPGQLYNKKGHA